MAASQNTQDCGVQDPNVHCRMPFCISCLNKVPKTHESVETKHPDGRQDVEVRVNRLNLENRTPEDDVAEAAIIDAMSKQKVRVVVVHKPTNESANFECVLPQVRVRAEAVVRAHMFRTVKPKPHEEQGMFDVLKGDYSIVEVVENGQVRVTSL